MKNERLKIGLLVSVSFFLGITLLGYSFLKAEVDESVVLSLHFDEGKGEIASDKIDVPLRGIPIMKIGE